MRPKVEHFVDLDAVAADAAGALDHDAQASLYDTLEWFRLTQAHILPDTPLLVARARDASSSAWLFLADRGGHADRFGSWYTLRYAPIFAGNPNTGERFALIAAIARSLNKLARISLHPVDDDALALLRAGFARAKWWTDAHVQTANWVAHTRDLDFAGYWSARPGRLRSTVKRKTGKADLAITLLDSYDADAWDAYEAVFAASWKGAEGSPAFLRALARTASTWGRTRMALAHDAAGTPLAAQFWTIDGDVATIHKLAYVDAAKALSPGSILSQAMFAHVLARDRPALIDFGTGDDPYKADWMDEKRSLHRFEAYNPRSVSGLVAYAKARVAALVARWRKP